MAEPEEKLVITGPYDPEIGDPKKRQDWIRFSIVIAILALVLVIIISPFISSPEGNEHWEILKMGLSGLMGVLGSAVTFYFGHFGRE